MFDLKHVVDFIIDISPFAIYAAVLVKLYRSWKTVRATSDETQKNRLAAVMTLLAVVIAVLLASNVYALTVYGKTYMSLRVFQLFLVGNCAVYWLLIDLLTKSALPEQGKLSESAD